MSEENKYNDEQVTGFLNPKKCWHVERQSGDSLHIPIETYCIKCNLVLLREGVDISILDKRNKTPTSEFIQAELLKLIFVKRVGLENHGKHLYATIEFREKLKGSDYVGGRGATPVLALREAVENYMERKEIKKQ